MTAAGEHSGNRSDTLQQDDDPLGNDVVDVGAVAKLTFVVEAPGEQEPGSGDREGMEAAAGDVLDHGAARELHPDGLEPADRGAVT